MFTFKVAPRYMLNDFMRLEGGIGAADDSQGKSLNGDIGLTFGTINEDKPWNYYGTLRAGHAWGFPGNVFGGDDITNSRDTTSLPNTYFSLLNLGAEGKVTKQMCFIFEGGFGYIFPVGHSSGQIVFVSCGVVFRIGN